MRIAKPLLLVIGVAMASVVMTIRRERAAEEKKQAALTKGADDGSA